MMPGWLKAVLSSLIAGLIAGAGAILTASQSGIVDDKTQMAAWCVAILAAGKDLQAFLSKPPST